MKFALSLVLCFMMLTGCVQSHVIDDVNIATGIGIDKSGGKQFLGSLMIPVFNPDKSFDNFTFTAKGNIMRDIISEMQKKASQPIVGGSLDLAFFSKEVARGGIIRILDVFLRDPSVGSRVYLAVIDGKAADVFKGNYGDRGNAAYLTMLIEHNMKEQNLPETNLHRFLAAFYQKGQDPYLPILKKLKPHLVSISGLALFKDEKMVDILSENKMFYFKLLVDKHTKGSVKVKDHLGESTVQSMNSKNNIEVSKKNPYEFKIYIKINGFLTEHQERTINKSEVHKIEKQLEKQVEQECVKMIKDFQKKDIDPVGFGHIAKTKTRNFDFDKWRASYQSATFKVHADVKITELGVVE